MTDTAKKRKLPQLYFDTKGTLRYPNIEKQDLGREFSDGKFKTDFILSKADAKPYIDRLKEIAKETMPSVKTPKLPFKELEDGTICFTAKSKRRPLVMDACKNTIQDEHKAAGPRFKVGGGTVAKMMTAVGDYATGGNKGLNLYLNSLQIFELKAWDPSGASAYKEEDGFTYDGSDEGSDEGSQEEDYNL